MASVGSIVGGAFAVFRQRPGAVAIWAITFFVGIIALSFLLVGSMVASMMGGSPAAMGDPATMIGRMLGPMLLFYAAIGFLTIILMNAVFRTILRPEERSFASMRIGMDELRIFGLMIVFVIAFLIVYFIFVLLVGMIIAGLGLAAGSRGAGAIIGLLVGLAALCAYVWFYVRISLLFPLSFYRRSFIELDGAWRLTSGRFWTLFASYLVVWVLTIGLFLLALVVAGGGGVFSGMMAGGDPGASREAMAEAMSVGGGMSLASSIVFFVLYLVVIVISIVLGPAIVASATRELLIEEGEFTDDVERTAEIFE